MRYRVEISNSAKKNLDRLPNETKRRAEQAIADLARDPRPWGCLKLKGRDGWRVRVGDYRIIYEIHDNVLLVVVIRVEHRSSAYRAA